MLAEACDRRCNSWHRQSQALIGLYWVKAFGELTNEVRDDNDVGML